MNGPHEQYVVQDTEALESEGDRPPIVTALWSDGSPPATFRDAPDRESLIAKSIEVDIIPRLLMAHLERPQVAAKPRPKDFVVPIIDESQISAFADMVSQESLMVSVERVSALVESGISLDSILSELFSGTARLLGERWSDDEASFLDVTLGLSNLQQLLRRFGPDFENVSRHQPNGCRLLLSAMPGEAHTFGIAVVEEYFRRDGWTVTMETPRQAQSLLNVLRESWYDVIGLSIGNSGSTAELGQLVRDIRKSSMNGAIKVIVGGNALQLAEDAIKTSGADMFSASAEEAVRDARQFIMNLRK